MQIAETFSLLKKFLICAISLIPPNNIIGFIFTGKSSNIFLSNEFFFPSLSLSINKISDNKLSYASFWITEKFSLYF